MVGDVTVAAAHFHRVLAGPSRAEILGLLRSADGTLTVQELADATGLHENTVRGHLDILVGNGYAERQAVPRRTPGRPQFGYSAIPMPEILPEPDSGSITLRLLARVLADQVADQNAEAGLIAQNAAEDWVVRHLPDSRGRRITTETEALGTIADLLRGRGYAPEIDVDRGEIVLHGCPYADLAQAQQQVICGIHLGLMLGTLGSMNSPFGARLSEIDPVTPRCVVQLLEELEELDDQDKVEESQ